MRFKPLEAGSDADHGRSLFGLAADLDTIDDSEALFEGDSQVAGHEVVSNGRVCATCHRGTSNRFSLPAPPLTDTIPLTDPLFVNITTDAGDDPDAFANLNDHGLVKYRINRFDPRRTPDDPYKQVFAWRKTPQLLNVGLNQGFLNDLRGRNLFETTRGAVFAHTQPTDDRFDDLFSLANGADMEAFMFGLFSDPQLAALRDPDDAMHDTLVDDPFYTVPIETWAQWRGQKVFEKNCFSCHNTPQTFSGLDNVEPQGNGDRPPNYPGWAPAVGRPYNIGIAEANLNDLRFTRYVGPGDYEPIVLTMADEDGTVVDYEVEFDIGLASTTGRTDDIGRFKVPQLRKLAANAPYFHDNSMDTIEEVVDYFDSHHYNHSHDGQRFPVHLSHHQKQDLIAFLYQL